MPFRAAFDCLWCGSPHACRGPDDLEGWAQLCPACVGKAGDNGFLRFRLRQALIERGAASRGGGAGAAAAASDVASAFPGAGAAAAPTKVTAAGERSGPVATSPQPTDARTDSDAELLAYYEARAPEYDDWYLRRGRYARGPIHDAAWNTELDAAGRWLDGLTIRGEIVELAAGTGWWSPLLASKGELSLYDGTAGPLERARERLLAHGLRAHPHVRDAWAEPDRAVDAVFTGFWLSHVPRDRLDAFLGIVRRWLRPGGTFAFIDSRYDPQSGAADHPIPADDTSRRRLADGREFTIVKVYYEPAELEAALARAGFEGAQVSGTGRFFLTGVAHAAGDDLAGRQVAGGHAA
ncbi:MAG TPA: class I SAM-dependent methyltransferase [Candidatus Limnocylindrales bacterium]